MVTTAIFLVAAACLMVSCVATGTTSIRRRAQESNWYDTVEDVPWWEERASFVDYPDAASEALREELALIPSAIGLDVTTRVSNLHEHFAVWSLLKGIVHRFRRQNQIIHVNPHYYIGTGVEEGCRKLELDVDTGLEREVQVVPTPAHCGRDCTNQGRYCVTPPPEATATTSSINATSTAPTGLEIIEETLRLICFDQIYSASDLRFNEYLNALEGLGCHDNTNTNDGEHISWESCSHEALYQLSGISKTAIDNCLKLAGGTTDDVMNVHLQHEIDRRKTKAFYATQDLPIIQVHGHQYRKTTFTSLDEHWSVENIFAFVCQVYRDETGTSPLGCRVCEECGDVRKCLWTLECNGQPFDMAELDDSQEASGATEPQGMITLEPIASNATTRPLALITTPSSEEIINPPSDTSPPAEEEREEPTEETEDETEEEAEVPTEESAGVSQQEDFDTVETGPLPPHSAAPTSYPTKAMSEPTTNSTTMESEAEMIELETVSAICILAAVLIVVCCFFQTRRDPDSSLRDRYIDSIQSRWMSRELDAFPGDGSAERLPGDLRRADTHNKTEYRSFWDFFKWGQEERPRRSLHDNVNKFARKGRPNKRVSLNAGRRYSTDGARSLQETIAAFSASISNSLDFSNSNFSLDFSGHSGHNKTKPKKKEGARYGKSHAAALAEAAASGQTPPRIPSTVTEETSEETAEAMISNVPDDTPYHLRYSPNWEAGYTPQGNSPENSSSSSLSNPSLNRKSSGGSNTDPGGSNRSSTRRFGGDESAASLYDDAEDVFNGLQDVTML